MLAKHPAHRPARTPADIELARAVKATGRQQEAIWARQQANNRLRSLLRDYYPQALAASCEPDPPRRRECAGQKLGDETETRR
jgi:hypothetical protein